MTTLVTGTSGKLGRLVVLSLLERGVPAGEVVATARDTSKIVDLADRGVHVRHADYSDPGSLKEALAGVDKVMLVSSSEVGQRLAQHRNVIDAAGEAGVELFGYTSVTRAQSSSLALAAEHRQTEDYLARSGLAHVLLRNSWYIENYTEQISQALAEGVVRGAAGSGRVSAATRADYAAAAAVVLTEPGHAGQVYELGGDAFTVAEYAAVVAEKSGRAISYEDLSPKAYSEVLVSAGLPPAVAELLADSDRGINGGELFVDTGDLERLLGRPVTTLADAVATALS